MSIARVQKEENANQLREELSGVPHAILVDFKGLSVENATDLRRKLRDGNARFKVVKNSTVLRAIEDLPLAELNDAFVGQTAIAYTREDVVALAKVLSEFAKDFETPNFKAGIVDGAPISQEQFEQLAKLPPREELIAKALYLMNYPLTGLVTALSGILKGFVVVLDQIRQQKEEAGEVAPAEAAAEGGEESPAEQAAAEGEDEAPAEEAAAGGAEEAPAEGGEESPAEQAAAEGEDEAPAEEAAAEGEEEAPAEEAAAEGAEEAPTEQAAADEEPAAEESSKEAGEAAGEEEEKS